MESKKEISSETLTDEEIEIILSMRNADKLKKLLFVKLESQKSYNGHHS